MTPILVRLVSSRPLGRVRGDEMNDGGWSGVRAERNKRLSATTTEARWTSMERTRRFESVTISCER